MLCGPQPGTSAAPTAVCAGPWYEAVDGPRGERRFVGAAAGLWSTAAGGWGVASGVQVAGGGRGQGGRGRWARRVRASGVLGAQRESRRVIVGR